MVASLRRGALLPVVGLLFVGGVQAPIVYIVYHVYRAGKLTWSTVALKSPEDSSLTRVQLQAKAKVAIASDSDGSADFWGVAGWEMALSVGFGKDKAMVTDCSKAPC